MIDTVVWTLTAVGAVAALGYAGWRAWHHPGPPVLPTPPADTGQAPLLPVLSARYVGTKAMDAWGELKPFVEVFTRRGRAHLMTSVELVVRAEGIVVTGEQTPGFLIPAARIGGVVGGEAPVRSGRHPSRVPPSAAHIHINWRHEGQDLRTHVATDSGQTAGEWDQAVRNPLDRRETSFGEETGT